MKPLYLISVIAVTSALMGCQIEITPVDTTLTSDVTDTTDTGSTDTGSTDTGSTDTGSTDTGSTDTGSTDTGSTDTGSTDTGSTDNTVANGVTLYWTAPLDRVNGSLIEYTEIGGYEIRYKQITDAEYTTVVISDASVEQYSFDSLTNADEYIFEVAVFDIDGLYSEFAIATASN